MYSIFLKPKNKTASDTHKSGMPGQERTMFSSQSTYILGKIVATYFPFLPFLFPLFQFGLSNMSQNPLASLCSTCLEENILQYNSLKGVSDLIGYVTLGILPFK